MYFYNLYVTGLTGVWLSVIYQVSKAQWLECWHRMPEALGLSLDWDLSFYHLLHISESNISMAINWIFICIYICQKNISNFDIEKIFSNICVRFELVKCNVHVMVIIFCTAIFLIYMHVYSTVCAFIDILYIHVEQMYG